MSKMAWHSCFILLLVLLPILVQGRIKPHVLPQKVFDCIDRAYKDPILHREAAESIFVSCISKYIWSDVTVRCSKTSNETLKYIASLMAPIHKLQTNRHKRQASHYRQRKEVRMMSAWERQNFINACNMLKRDTSFTPNLYDLLAQFHDDTVSNSAHFGPAFLPWHRLFLFMFEEALRSKIPDVTIPYWDSTLDSNMFSNGGNPLRSIVWSDTFFGNGNGFVQDGPFAWQTPYGPLNRNHGSGGRLFTDQDVNNIFKMHSSGQLASYLEELHNSVHNWVGGHMSSIRVSPVDPIFFMHHAYVDYLWWQWQQSVGSPAAYTYPQGAWGAHSPNSPLMNIYLGRGVRYTNADGYSAGWANMVSYQASPSCSEDGSCGSQYLTCTNNVCVSREIVQQVLQPESQLMWRNRRSTDYDVPHTIHKPQSKSIPRKIPFSPSEPVTDFSCYGFSVQNDFRLNCERDHTLWAYLPVKIVHLRPDGKVYNSHLVRNGKPDFSCDMYTYGAAYNNRYTKSYMSSQHPSAYRYCKEDESGTFRATIKSHGMNYVGYYSDYAILDNRQPVDSKISYIGIRKPGQKATKVLLSVFDHCGRICRPKCLVPNTNPPIYRSCSGLLNINKFFPRFYGNTYQDAVFSYWNFNVQPSCPTERYNKLYIVFYCDYRTHWWPWRGCKLRGGSWKYTM